MPRFSFGVPNGPQAQENWEGFPFADFLVCYEDFWACCSHFSACCWEKLRSNRSTSAQSAAGCSANFYVTYSYLFSDSWMWDYKYSDHNYWQINTMTNNIKHHQTTTFFKKDPTFNLPRCRLQCRDDGIAGAKGWAPSHRAQAADAGRATGRSGPGHHGSRYAKGQPWSSLHFWESP